MTLSREEYIRAITDGLDPAQPVYVVADTYWNARTFCHAVSAPRNWRLVIEADRLRGVGPGALILAVDTGGRLRPGMPDQLLLTQATVKWVNLDQVMGVDRDR